MTNDWPKVGFFAAGLAIGGVATAALVLGPYSPVARKKVPVQPPSAQVAGVAFRGAECPMEPAAIVAGNQDGRYRMPAELAGYAGTEPVVFVAMGTEAEAAGRPHDAEVAFLMACRVADRFKGAGSLAAADARYELARYYAGLAKASGKDAPNCGEILQRAELMYSDSHQLYRATYGPDHEKSRQAAEGLASVQQTLMAQAGVPAPAAASASVAAPGSAVAQPPNDGLMREITVAPAPKPARPVQAERTRERPPPKKVAARQAKPMPACASARTTAERLICSDAELARLDREVGYLQARARNAARYEAEWRRREAMCRDRACVLQVIATKRNQLMADINSA